MAIIKPKREPFDRDRDYVVNRALTLNGKPLGPGDSFDKALVNARTHRQLYEARRISMAPLNGSNGKAPKLDIEGLSKDQLITMLEDNGIVPRRSWSQEKLADRVKRLVGEAA